jgi:uncharacterized coiled-coil DUF342 family protein
MSTVDRCMQMAQSNVKIGEYQDRVLTIVKGKFGFKNKSQAINFIIDRFEEQNLEPELRPEFIKELNKLRKGPFKTYSTIDELRKEIEHV